MAYPTFYPFKTRVINTATTSTAATCVVPVPARAKFVGGYIATNGAVANTVPGVWEIDWSGATSTSTPAVITGLSNITSTTTTTAVQSVQIPIPAPIFYVNAGDVLSVVGSSTPGFSASLVLQEF